MASGTGRTSSKSMRVASSLQVAFIVSQIGTMLLVSRMAAAETPPTSAPTTTQPATEPVADTADLGPPVARKDPFHLRPSDLYLAMESEYDYRKVRSSSPYRRDQTQKNKDFRISELAGVTLSGDVYDPNLLEYRAALEFGLEQDRFVEEINRYRDSEHDSGFVGDYDISLDALKTKPVSVHAYARRAENRIPRRFLPSLHELDTEAGASTLITAGPTSTEIGLSWQDVERTNNHLKEDNEELETSRYYLDHTWTISDDQKLRVQYDHDREKSDYQGTRYQFDTRRDEIRLEHELAFGPEKKHLFDTLFRYNAEQGDLARDELELVPRLTLTHNDQLKTIYRYGFYRYQQGNIDVSQHKLDAQALYTPTQDLRISMDGYGLYEQDDQDVTTSEFGGGPDVNYHKATSVGDLNINAAFAYQRTDINGDAGQRVVIGEAHSLGGSRPVFLTKSDVILTTVMAHDEKRLRYFVKGIDFLLIPIGNRVRVERILTGRIASDDVVYFDYQYRIPAQASLNSYRSDFLIEHTFKFGLTPYYGLESRCEDVESSRATPWRGEDSHRHRLGLRYEKDRYTVGTEYEIFDDSVEPYDAWHLTGRAGLFRSATHSLDLSGELSRYWFEGGWDRRRVWWLDVDLKDTMQINPFLSAITGAAYHREDDSRDGKTNGVEAQCGLRYNRGSLMIDLTVEYDLLSIADNRENGLGVYLNVRRNLDELLPSPKGGVR